jgi:hypothetical protein
MFGAAESSGRLPMTRITLIKTLVGSAILILGSSDADAYIRIIKDRAVSCTYSDASVGRGRVTAVTLRNRGRHTYPKGTGYIISHVNPAGKTSFNLWRELGPLGHATVPISENWGTSPSQCSVEIALHINISVPPAKGL